MVWQLGQVPSRDLIHENPREHSLWVYDERVEDAAQDDWAETHPDCVHRHVDAWANVPWHDAATMAKTHRTLRANNLATLAVTMCYASWQQAVEERQASINAWAKQWAALRLLPQLFVAV